MPINQAITKHALQTSPANFTPPSTPTLSSDKKPAIIDLQIQAGVAELVDATDSKSVSRNWECGFKSLLRHWLPRGAKPANVPVIIILMTGAFLLLNTQNIPVNTSAATAALLAQSQDEESKESQDSPPPTLEEQAERDESDLPTEAFSPMKLYQISTEGDATATDPQKQDHTPTTNPGEPGIIRWPYLTVNLNDRYLDIQGVVGINEGYLEQVACLPGTRGYESLSIVFARPSHIHAALLLLGLEPGKPGKWEAVEVKNKNDDKDKEPDDPAPNDQENEPAQWTYTILPPEGAKVSVTLIYEKELTDSKPIQTDPDQQPLTTKTQKIEVPANQWIIDYRTGKNFPVGPWIFGGSALKKDFTETERYLADLTGSIIGIVTFGDETIGWNEVWPDEDVYTEPEWICNTKVMPPWNTPITVRIRPWQELNTDPAEESDSPPIPAPAPELNQDDPRK